jgi:hypothetical protein
MRPPPSVAKLAHRAATDVILPAYPGIILLDCFSLSVRLLAARLSIFKFVLRGRDFDM